MDFLLAAIHASIRPPGFAKYPNESFMLGWWLSRVIDKAVCLLSLGRRNKLAVHSRSSRGASAETLGSA